jgi:very-short-patch-repair endonuclease
MRGPNRKKVPIARKLRRNTTSAESKLWAELRNRQLAGFKFVRQGPIGRFAVDFVCREARLIVEVDGATHSSGDEIESDAERSRFLVSLGYDIVRVQNDDVYNAMEGVLRTIQMALEGSAPHPPGAARRVPPSPR